MREALQLGNALAMQCTHIVASRSGGHTASMAPTPRAGGGHKRQPVPTQAWDGQVVFRLNPTLTLVVGSHQVQIGFQGSTWDDTFQLSAMSKMPRALQQRKVQKR